MVARDRFKYRFKLSGLRLGSGFFKKFILKMGLKLDFALYFALGRELLEKRGFLV